MIIFHLPICTLWIWSEDLEELMSYYLFAYNQKTYDYIFLDVQFKENSKWKMIDLVVEGVDATILNIK